MQKQATTKTTKQEKVATLEEKVIADIIEMQKADNNIKMQKVTGYTSVKYGNKVLFELHLKKKSVTHLTFSTQQKVYETLKDKKLVLRVVPASYGWKYNTECLLTADFYKHFKAILKSVVSEAVEERNLKEQKATKKVVNA